MGAHRWDLEGDVSGGRLIQRMSFGRVTHMTCPRAALLPIRGPRPTLDISLPPCVTQESQSGGTSPWPVMLCGVFFKTTREAFPSSWCVLSISVALFSFQVFHYQSFAIWAATSGAGFQKVKSKRSVTLKRQTVTPQQLVCASLIDTEPRLHSARVIS